MGLGATILGTLTIEVTLTIDPPFPASIIFLQMTCDTLTAAFKFVPITLKNNNPIAMTNLNLVH